MRVEARLAAYSLDCLIQLTRIDKMFKELLDSNMLALLIKFRAWKKVKTSITA